MMETFDQLLGDLRLVEKLLVSALSRGLTAGEESAAIRRAREALRVAVLAREELQKGTPTSLLAPSK